MNSPNTVLFAFCLAFNLAFVSTEDTWLTQYRQDFRLVCPQQTFVNFIKSIHDNGQEDRVWYIHCAAPVYGAKAYNDTCAWTEYINTFDHPISFFCPEDQAMAGFEGTYSVPTRDRIFKLLCCDIRVGYFKQLRYIHAVQRSGYLNSFDGRLEFDAGPAGVILGIESYHDNGAEDRRFSFFHGKASK